MDPATVCTHQDTPNQMAATVIRQAVETLNSLEAETADHLKALSFVLIRVARADGRVCGEERLRMEEILIEHAKVTTEQAILVTEISCHRAQLADCAIAYAISRGLRSKLDSVQRASVIGLLKAVADADGRFLSVEHREIAQIAAELGFDPAEVLDRE